MNARLKRTLEGLVPRSVLRALRRRTSRDRLTVLAYHGIPSREHFQRQVDLLAGMCRFVDPDSVLASLRQGATLPPGATLVTFDDGERSVFENALPVLREHEIRSVLFPVASLIDSEQPFWWTEAAWLAERGLAPALLEGLTPAAVIHRLTQVSDVERRALLDDMRARSPDPAPRYPHLTARELATWIDGGQEVGNHTMTHPCLPQCAPEAIRRELVDAHERLRGLLGTAPRVFAYPNGDASDAAARIIAECGYPLAFTFEHRLAAWPSEDPMRVPRIRVNGDDTLDRLALSVSGLHPAIHALRVRAGRAVR